MTGAARVLAVYVVVFFLASMAFALLGRSRPLDQMFFTMNTTHSSFRFLAAVIAAGFADGGAISYLFLIIPTLIGALLIDIAGRRALAADARLALDLDDRRPILFLRSFDEDQLKIACPSMRSGIIRRAMMYYRRSFEELLAVVLSRFGPVIAVSPPGTRLPRLGAAKMQLPNDDWQSTVSQLAADALFVVISGTPQQVRPGLAFELSVVGTLPATRLLVVLAPWPHRRFQVRWSNFRAAASNYPQLRPICDDWVQSGAHVLAHLGANGWVAWGARIRSDRSYAITLARSVEAALPAWQQESVRSAMARPAIDAR